jgi:hypothetical protein
VGRESRDNGLVPVQVAGSYSMANSDYSAVAVEVPWLAGAKQLALGDGTMTDRSQAVPVRW